MHSLSINCSVLTVAVVTPRAVPTALFILPFSLFASFFRVYPCSDTSGPRWPLIQPHLFSCVCGEGGTLQQILLACWEARKRVNHLVLPRPKVHICQVHTTRALGCSARPLSQGGSAFCALPHLSHSSSWVLHKGTDPDGLWVLCPSPRSSCSGQLGAW